MPIHPVAAAAARAAGLRRDHVEAILLEVSNRNPALLVGGYHVDIAILGIWISLMEEAADGERVVLSDEEIQERITMCLSAMYEGII